MYHLTLGIRKLNFPAYSDEQAKKIYLFLSNYGKILWKNSVSKKQIRGENMGYMAIVGGFLALFIAFHYGYLGNKKKQKK